MTSCKEKKTRGGENKLCFVYACINQAFFSTVTKKLKDEKLKTQGKNSKLKQKTQAKTPGFGKSN